MINSSAPLILSSEECLLSVDPSLVPLLFILMLIILIGLVNFAFIVIIRYKHYKEFCNRLDRDVKKDMDK